MHAKMKGLVRQVFLAPSYAMALKRGRDLIAKFKDRYPAAMECLERNLEECVTTCVFQRRIAGGSARPIGSNG
jgi:transposase-like protein